MEQVRDLEPDGGCAGPIESGGPAHGGQRVSGADRYLVNLVDAHRCHAGLGVDLVQLSQPREEGLVVLEGRRTLRARRQKTRFVATSEARGVSAQRESRVLPEEVVKLFLSVLIPRVHRSGRLTECAPAA